MNMKLTRLRDLLKAPSESRGFGHNFISKKIRLMREKCSVSLRNGRIFYPFPSLKMLKNTLGSRFRGANGFYTSHGFAFLFDTLSGDRTTLKNLILRQTQRRKLFRWL